MKYEKCDRVYACCGRYYAPTKATAGKTIKCQTCKKVLNAPLQIPHITIVKES